MGALFHTPTALADRDAVIARLAGRQVIVLTPFGDAGLDVLPLADAHVLVVGNEKRGVHPRWADVATARAAIPMGGIVDSLNVATAAAIVLWEAYRRASGRSSGTGVMGA
jgi:RNA methyltransferase, TrmH family